MFLKYDIVFLSETWLKPLDTSNFNVCNYICINKPRKSVHKKAKRGSGGVLLYIHKRLICYMCLLDNNIDDRIWIKFTHKLSKGVTASSFLFLLELIQQWC